MIDDTLFDNLSLNATHLLVKSDLDPAEEQLRWEKRDLVHVGWPNDYTNVQVSCANVWISKWSSFRRQYTTFYQ